MQPIDRSIEVKMFNDFDYDMTRYTDKATDVGEEVEQKWADLGIYGNCSLTASRPSSSE